MQNETQRYPDNVMQHSLEELMLHLDPQVQLRTSRGMMIKLGDTFKGPSDVFSHVIYPCLHASYRDTIQAILKEISLKSLLQEEELGNLFFTVISEELWKAEIALHYVNDSVSVQMLYTNDAEYKEAELIDVTGRDDVERLLEDSITNLKSDKIYYSLNHEATVVNGFSIKRAVLILYLPAEMLR